MPDFFAVVVLLAVVVSRGWRQRWGGRVGVFGCVVFGGCWVVVECVVVVALVVGRGVLVHGGFGYLGGAEVCQLPGFLTS